MTGARVGRGPAGWSGLPGWGGLPGWARWVLAGYAVGFTEGTCAHLLDLLRGGVRVYASYAPLPAQVFFVGLVVLDPLVVALVLLGRPAAARLACGVMVLDGIANWYVDWPLLRENPAWLLRPVGLLPITLFALFVVVTAAPVRRATRHRPCEQPPTAVAG
ncbi:hypothetical protein ACIQGZ_26420 [Streptomyces sp. NPDC092296]|uniref:hypothetical protein n=1 Tax=Streptomyces sp. NPDC092296 TaxID=3366012 RepID=UPI0037FDF05B